MCLHMDETGLSGTQCELVGHEAHSFADIRCY